MLLRQRKGNIETTSMGKDEFTQTPGARIDDTPLNEVTSKDKRPLSKKRRLYFVLGGLMGALLASFFSTKVDLDDFHRLRRTFDEFDFDFPDIFPKGVLDELVGNITDRVKPATNLFADTDFLVGHQMANEGLRIKHPVIIVPGVISSGLESWSTSSCSKPYFRKRMWGTSTMLRAVLLDKECWLNTLKLDPLHGLDPEDHKLRAAEGIQAADYFIGGYWIWSKVIENLAVISYDLNNLHLASYDWRLSFHNLEIRDQFFSKLKSRIEIQKNATGLKTVIIGHSMGSQVVYYFFKWVEAQGDFGGNGGPTWVEEHIESFVNIAGPLLGVPKAVTSVLSGEMRDTVELNPVGVYILERFFSRRERASLFQNWGGISSMLVKGGEKIWGNLSGAPDDIDGMSGTFGALLNFRPQTKTISSLDAEPQQNLSVANTLDYVFQYTPHDFHRMINTNYSFGISYTKDDIERNEKDHRTWSNPLESRLPNAPSMKIFCLYGYGKDTERAYFYSTPQENPAKAEGNEMEGDGLRNPRSRCSKCLLNETMHDALRNREEDTKNVNFPQWQISIDSDMNIDNKAVPVRNGVMLGEGDGTVSLMSLGFMCAKGWKHPRYNPAGIPVHTREIYHEPTPLEMRGGPKSADHIDVLGSTELNEAILKIVSGREDLFTEQYFSPILSYAEKVDLDHE